jgi:serine/threonine protein phosphatase 1
LKKFINKLLVRRTQPQKPLLPPDTRIYCIGDVHGCYDLLNMLMAQIKEDAQGFTGRIVIVYLGDFIDRGRFSKEVVDFILNDKLANAEYIYLRGNHEQTLLDFLQEEDVGRSWLAYGGLATLASYNVQITKVPSKVSDFLNLQQQLRENLPASHYRFFSETRLYFSVGKYFFVHAGINPFYPLAKQTAEEMLWIRDEFLNFTDWHEKIIVHGHSITDDPQLFGNRIGIDTGAFASGILTCLVLQGDKQRLLQTQPLVI